MLEMHDEPRTGAHVRVPTAGAGDAGHDPAVAALARKTFQSLDELIAACIAGAQRAGDIKPDEDPARLAGLLLAVLRGIEALGKGGSSPAVLRAIAETTVAILPVSSAGHGSGRKAALRDA